MKYKIIVPQPSSNSIENTLDVTELKVTIAKTNILIYDALAKGDLLLAVVPLNAIITLDEPEVEAEDDTDATSIDYVDKYLNAKPSKTKIINKKSFTIAQDESKGIPIAELLALADVTLNYILHGGSRGISIPTPIKSKFNYAKTTLQNWSHQGHEGIILMPQQFVRYSAIKNEQDKGAKVTPVELPKAGWIITCENIFNIIAPTNLRSSELKNMFYNDDSLFVNITQDECNRLNKYSDENKKYWVSARISELLEFMPAYSKKLFSINKKNPINLDELEKIHKLLEYLSDKGVTNVRVHDNTLKSLLALQANRINDNPVVNSEENSQENTAGTNTREFKKSHFIFAVNGDFFENITKGNYQRIAHLKQEFYDITSQYFTLTLPEIDRASDYIKAEGNKLKMLNLGLILKFKLPDLHHLFFGNYTADVKQEFGYIAALLNYLGDCNVLEVKVSEEVYNRLNEVRVVVTD